METDKQEAETLLPTQLLIDELKNEDIQLRLNSVRHLGSIARALGPERTRNELLNFIAQECIDDEDEVLLALAEELVKFTDLVGGPEESHVLLKPLESLAAVEETSVREKSVESLATIIQSLPDTSVLTYVVPLITRLSTGEWFTSRASSCGLFAPAYKKIDEKTRASLRDQFWKLCEDEMPMVRRAAASHLKKFVKQLEPNYIQTELLPAFLKLAKDDQDSVRLLVIPTCAALARIFSADTSEGSSSASASTSENSTNNNNGLKKKREIIMPVIRGCAADESWRVRYMLADNFVDLCENLGSDITQDELVGIFVGLMKDAEAEVRTAAGFKVTGVSKLLPVDITAAKIIPCVKDLVSDGSKHARAALASVVMGLAGVLGQEKTLELLLPLFLQLLKDDFPEVRLNIISKLDVVNKVMGVEKLSQSLLPAIVELAEDRQWRVRLAIIEYIPLLAAQLGVEFFDEKLGNLCMTWLGDCVYSIREAATKNLKELTKVFGVEWAESHIIPKVLGLYTHPNYLYRMTTLFSIGMLADAVGPDVVVNSMLPLVIRMADDPVPNIRFNVAKTMGILIPIMKAGPDGAVVQQKVKACLAKLYDDKDRDVKYFAAQAMSIL